MRIFTEKTKGLLWHFLIYIVVATGIAKVIEANLNFSISLALIFLWLSLIFIILELCLKKWYILPLVLVLLAAIVMILYISNNDFSSFITLKTNDIYSYIFESTLDSTITTDLNISMMVVSLPTIGLVIYLLVRKISSFLPVSLLIIFFYACCQIARWKNIYVAAMFSIIALLVKMGLSYFNKSEEKPSPNISLTALVISLLAVLMTSSSVKDVRYPIDRSWRWLRMQVGDINDLFVNKGNVGILTMPRDLFNTDQVGLNMKGGPITLDDSPYLLVEAPNNTLLKGSIQNYYTGKMWVNTIPKTQYRFESRFWKNELEEAFLLNLGKGDELPKQLQRLMRVESTIMVQHLVQNTSSLYGAGRVYNVKSKVGDSIIPYFDMNGDMFSKYYVGAKASYEIDTYLIMYESQKFERLMAEVPLVGGSYDPTFEQYYLQIPDSLPSEVGLLAKGITEDISNYYMKAVALKNYLGEFSYTLSPSIIPEDKELVEYFLETKEGYCVYYASAMVVMARTIGIPARYVQGFQVPIHPYGKSVYLTGENAHAWAELYFEGIGWIPFDATPRDDEDEIKSVSDEPIYIPVFPTPDQDNNLNVEITNPSDSSSSDNSLGRKTIAIILVSLIVFSLIFIFLLLPPILTRRDLSKRYITRKYPSRVLRLEKYYENALEVFRLFSSNIILGDTPYVVAEKVEKEGLNKSYIWEITDCLVRMRYEDILPSDAELERMHEITNYLEKTLKQTKGILLYYRLRLIKPTVFRVKRKTK